MKSQSVSLSYINLFWMFILGSILGVIIEMVWCYAYFGRIESRVGLVLGPFNQIYGFGVILLTLCLYKLQDKSWWIVAIFSAVIGAVYEYLCSYFQEIIYNTMSWDYTGSPLSINGRTSLIFAVFWGLLGLLWIKVLMPVSAKYIAMIPQNISVILTIFMTAFIIIDIIISSMAVQRRVERHNNISPINSVESFFDEYYSDNKLKKIYPNMVVLK